MEPPFRYYPVTPAQRTWGLYVTCVGHNTTQPGATFPSPEHPDKYYFTWKVVRSFKNNIPIIQLFAATVTDLLANDNHSPFSAAASIPMLVAALLEAPKSDQTADDTSSSAILRAQMHITEHLSETIDFEALAQKVGLTYRSFLYLLALHVAESEDAGTLFVDADGLTSP